MLIIFVIKKREKKWKLRPKKVNTCSRLYNVDIKEGERYFLRLLLNYKTGATSFNDLRTIDEVEFPNFR